MWLSCRTRPRNNKHVISSTQFILNHLRNGLIVFPSVVVIVHCSSFSHSVPKDDLSSLRSLPCASLFKHPPPSFGSQQPWSARGLCSTFHTADPCQNLNALCIALADVFLCDMTGGHSQFIPKRLVYVSTCESSHCICCLQYHKIQSSFFLRSLETLDLDR